MQGNDVVNLQLHRGQFAVYRDNSRRIALCCGRRWGKSRLQIATVIRDALGFDREVNQLSPETVLVALPTIGQARRIMWQPLAKWFEQVPGCYINQSDMRIVPPGKPQIIVTGMEAADRIRGLRLWAAHIDECQDIRPGLLASVVEPALADTPGSRMLLTFTPKGKTNWLYGYTQRPDVRTYNFPTSDNPFVPAEEIERARQTLPPKVFQQEFEASWVSFDGQVLSEFSELNHYKWDAHSGTGSLQEWAARTGLPPGRTYLGVDFGDVNPAYVVVVQSGLRFYVGEWVTLGDGKNPVPAQTFYDRLASASRRWDVYRAYCDPSRPAAIVDIRRVGQGTGQHGLQRAIKAENAIAPGNSLLNSLFYQQRLSVPASSSACGELESYSRQPLAKGSEQFGDKVAPGQYDHCIDALRYCLYTIDANNGGVVGVPQPGAGSQNLS